MTVADNTSRNQYTATSGQTVFAYTFEIVDKDDIVVLKNGTTLSEGTDYTVSGVGTDSGGNITLTVGASTSDVLTLYRDMPYSRTQNYTNSGDFLASDVNSDFDNLWLAGEQTNRAFSQSIRKPITDSDSISMELPEASERANKTLGFSATGGIEMADVDLASVTATAAEINVLDGITASTAELNYVDGVTSSIQTQLDAKGTVNSLSDLGVTASAAELNYVDGVTSSIQTQLDGKLSNLSPTFTGTASFGDLDIYSDGSNSIIKEDGAGNLLIRGTSLVLQATDSANYIQCLDEGAVTLYHNAAPKLRTASSGVTVTGRMSAGEVRITIGSEINPTDSGVAGDLHFSSTYIYVCVATNTWKRVALSTWNPEF